jgi:hypothetical protein
VRIGRGGESAKVVASAERISVRAVGRQCEEGEELLSSVGMR